MTTTEYRGYEIVPKRQWSSWCVAVYPTRADLPILTSSILRTLASRREDAVTEAMQTIDGILSAGVRKTVELVSDERPDSTSRSAR